MGETGFVAFNISLFIFFVSLIIAGAKRSYWMYVSKEGSFTEMQDSIVPYYISFFIFGNRDFVSLLIVATPIFKALLQKIKT